MNTIITAISIGLNTIITESSNLEITPYLSLFTIHIYLIC